MNISIVASLDTRYTKRDGSCAIIVRIGRDNRTLPIPTGFSVPEAYWNENKRHIKTSYRGVSSVERLNNQINAEVKFVKDVALELEDAGTLDSMSLMDIKNRVINLKKGGLFFPFAEVIFAELEKAKRVSTKNAYAAAVTAIENFHGSRNLHFKQITVDFLKRFEAAHFANENKSKATLEMQRLYEARTGKKMKVRQNTANGLAAYLRAIRKIFNEAIKRGVVAEKYYPFKKYQIKTQPTQKRAIERDLLADIFALSLPAGHRCFNARNIFVLSYLLNGMNYYDIALLNDSHIIDGRIKYQRSKTSKPFDIKITPSIDQILHYYRVKGAPYIFNIVKRDTPDLIDKDIKWSRKRHNNKLKEIAEMCHIETNLTSYVSRHSFATEARRQNVPIDAIQAMLGHSSVKTTEIYLASLPSEILDEYSGRLTIPIAM